jgi:hypothetical protein
MPKPNMVPPCACTPWRASSRRQCTSPMSPIPRP